MFAKLLNLPDRFGNYPPLGRRLCVKCKKPVEDWELMCEECILAYHGDADHDLYIAPPSLGYSFSEFLTRLEFAVIVMSIALTCIYLLRGLSYMFWGDEPQVGVSLMIFLIGMFLIFFVISGAFEELKGLMKSILISMHILTHERTNYVSRARVVIPYTNRIWEELRRFDEPLPPWNKLPSETWIPLKDVTAIKVSQGFWAKQLGFGTLIFCTRGHPQGAITFEGVAKPLAFQEKVTKLIKCGVSDILDSSRIADSFEYVTKSEGHSLKKPVSRMLKIRRIAYVVVGIIGFILLTGYLQSRLSGETLRPGESRSIRMATEVVAFARHDGSAQLEWDDSDNRAFDIRIYKSEEALQVSVKSVTASVSDLSKEGKIARVEYAVIVSVPPGTPDIDIKIIIVFRHPKLKPPQVTNEPFTTIQLKVRNSLFN